MTCEAGVHLLSYLIKTRRKKRKCYKVVKMFILIQKLLKKSKNYAW